MKRGDYTSAEHPMNALPANIAKGPGELINGGQQSGGWGNESVAMQTAGPTGPSIDPKAILSAFRRRWFLAITIGAIFGAVAAFATYQVIPAPYGTSAELLISSVQHKLLFDTAERRAAFNTYKQTQMRLVKSPYVLQAALRPKEISELSLIREATNQVDWLEENISVSSPAAEFIRISISGEKPKELASLVNAVTQAYLTEVVDESSRDRRKRLNQLDDIARQKDEAIKIKRKSYEALAVSLNASKPSQADYRQQHLLDMHIQLRREWAQISFELMKAQIQLATLEDSGEELSTVQIPDAVIDSKIAEQPEYQSLQERVAQKASLLRDQSSILIPGHARLKSMEKEVADLRESLSELREELRPRIVEQLSLQYGAQTASTSDSLREQITHLEGTKQGIEAELENIKIEERATGINSFKLEQIDEEISLLAGLANVAKQEKERLEVELDQPIGIKLLKKAEVPYARDTKKKMTMTGMAGMGVFGFFVVGIVLFEFQLRRISSLNEVADGLSLRVMGALPILPRSVTTGKGRRNASRSAYWHSVLTESIDAARTMLLRDARLESMNVVMIASAMGGEGKTTLSCHLSTSIARAGRKTILVDCDMRRPSVHKVFDLPLTPGLCEVLRGEAKLEDVIQPVSPEGLYVIPAGKINQRLLQILAHEGIGPVLAQLKTMFDFIVIDSSPVLPVTDALLVAQDVDGVIFSIRRDVSRVSKVMGACQRLGMLGVPLLGTVVIGLDDGSYGFRYPYRYGYGYRNGYNSYNTQPQP